MILTRQEQSKIDMQLQVLHRETIEMLWSLQDHGEYTAALERAELEHSRLKAIIAEEQDDTVTV